LSNKLASHLAKPNNARTSLRIRRTVRSSEGRVGLGIV